MKKKILTAAWMTFLASAPTAVAMSAAGPTKAEACASASGGTCSCGCFSSFKGAYDCESFSCSPFEGSYCHFTGTGCDEE